MVYLSLREQFLAHWRIGGVEGSGLGVGGPSFSGWSLTWVSGREFNISSDSAEIVVNNSSVSFWDPRIIRSDRFAV